MNKSMMFSLGEISYVSSILGHEKIHGSIISPQSAHEAILSFAHWTFAIRFHGSEFWMRGQIM